MTDCSLIESHLATDSVEDYGNEGRTSHKLLDIAGVGPIMACDRLTELEKTIEQGLQTFVEVGTALMEIRDKRLYRGVGFHTFEDYCRERWKWSRVHAHRHIQAAKVVALLPTGNKPKSERQARELVGLKPSQIKQIAEKVDFTAATAKDVRQLVRRVQQDNSFAPGSDAEAKLITVAAKACEISPTMVYLAKAIETFDRSLFTEMKRGGISLCDAVRRMLDKLEAEEGLESAPSPANTNDPQPRQPKAIAPEKTGSFPEDRGEVLEND